MEYYGFWLLVTSEDPGGVLVDDKAVNRQIVSSFEGIKRVTTKYVVRTDMVFNSNQILHYLDKYNLTLSRILVLSDTSSRFYLCWCNTRYLWCIQY